MTNWLISTSSKVPRKIRKNARRWYSKQKFKMLQSNDYLLAMRGSETRDTETERTFHWFCICFLRMEWKVSRWRKRNHISAANDVRIISDFVLDDLLRICWLKDVENNDVRCWDFKLALLWTYSILDSWRMACHTSRDRLDRQHRRLEPCSIQLDGRWLMDSRWAEVGNILVELTSSSSWLGTKIHCSLFRSSQLDDPGTTFSIDSLELSTCFKEFSRKIWMIFKHVRTQWRFEWKWIFVREMKRSEQNLVDWDDYKIYLKLSIMICNRATTSHA